VAQHAEWRACRRRTVFLTGNWRDIGASTRELHDLPGKLPPRAGAGIGHVIQPVVIAFEQLKNTIGDVHGVARRADLIIHHAKGLSFASETEHRLNKITSLAATPPYPVKATRADHKMPRAISSNRVFAGKLAEAVNVDRAGW